MVTIVILPQRLQIVNGLSPVDAGIHILPLLLLTAVGAFVAGIITSKVNCAWYMLLFANGMITLGTGLMSSLPTGHDIPAVNYFYQAMLGFGFGMGLSSLLVLSRCEVPLADNGMSILVLVILRVISYANFSHSHHCRRHNSTPHFGWCHWGFIVPGHTPLHPPLPA